MPRKKAAPRTYKVMNPYNQPRWAPVLSGPRRPDSPEEHVLRDWYEGEEIPEELFSQRQLDYFLSRGIICPTFQD